MHISKRSSNIFFTFFVVVITAKLGFAQNFTVIDTLKGVEEGHVEWGDFDNDGDLDILLTGDAQPVFTQIYENRAGTFIERKFDFLNVRNSHVSWADYDNDGDLDVLVQGRDQDGDESAQLYRNDGNAFSEVETDIDGFEKGFSAWGDYDNDGDLDLVIAGDLNEGDDNFATLYRNDGDGEFTEIDAGILGGEDPGIDWGDFDKDGDLDLLISGEGDDDFSMRVYRNTGGVFQDVEAGLFPIVDGSLEWGDFDNDGDLDILSAGEDGDFFFTIIYENNAGSFEIHDSTLTGIQDGRAGWGDLDNDGDLDMLVVGDADTNEVAKLFRNDNGNFVPFENQPLPKMKAAWFDFGDFDNDGDLDLVMAGDHDNFLTIVVRNDAPVSNTPPESPTSLNTIVTRDSIIFEWQPANDAETPANSLTYNLRVGSATGAVDIVSPSADPATGFRLLPEPGNVDGGARWRLERDLPKGQYFWSVQTIDNGMASSAFAPEQTFAIVFPPPPENLQVTHAENGEINLLWDESSDPDVTRYRIYTAQGGGPLVLEDSVDVTDAQLTGFNSPDIHEIAVTAVDNAGNASKFSQRAYAAPSLLAEIALNLPEIGDGDVAWGDYDNDGDLDLFITGEQIDGSTFSDVLENSNGVFNPISSDVTPLGKAAATWGDFNGDGWLDLAVIGESAGRPVSKIYRNTGDGGFVDIDAPLIGVRNGDLAWGDYDNDGDLDLLLAGQANDGTPVSRVYRYIGADEFLSSNAAIQDVQNAAVAWADYGQDFDLDILLVGENREGDRISRIYRNTNGAFSERDEPLADAKNAAAGFLDFDNDGDLDLLIAGQEEDGAATRLYASDGGDFSDTKLSFVGVENGAIELADVDNDGVEDILVSGTGQNGRSTRLYKRAADQFQEIVTAIPGLADGSFHLADFDNDGDLDVAVSGRTGEGPLTRIYRNNSNMKNAPPSTPVIMPIAQARNVFTPNWESASDDETPQNSLTYNLRIGTSSGADDVFAGMAQADGLRRVSQPGNVSTATQWPIKILQPGTYFYSVQAIDNGRQASAFAPEQTFEFSPPPPPENVIALGGNKEVELSWGAVNAPSAQKYYVYGGLQPRPLTLLDSTAGVSQTSVIIEGLLNNTPYFFRVATLDTSEILSDFSADASATPGLFSEVPNQLTQFEGLNDAAAIWGDVDNDGDLDVIYAGETSAQLPSSFVYRNLGNNRFEDTESEIDSVLEAALDLGDYDNDGDLDLVLTGALTGGNAQSSRIYNNSNGVFLPTSDALQGVAAEPNSVAWGDYDNDGDLDLLLTGDGEGGRIAAIYKNQNGAFSDAEVGFAEMRNGAALWGDLDNDGDLDVVLTGRSNDGEETSVYQNNDGVFELLETNIIGSRRSDAQLGDFDNDGDLDLILNGNDGDDDIMKFYRNDGDFQFEDVSDFDFTIDEGIAAWGDYDNDGDLDLLISGDDEVSEDDITRIYRNENGVFVNTGIPFPGMDDCDAAWGDYDNDGDLDLLLSGKVSGGVGYTRIFRNNLNTQNQPPQAPSQLSAVVGEGSAALSWAQTTDAETAPDGLTYNLRVGSAPGAFDVVAPMTNAQNGARLIAAKGNLQHNTNWALKNLAPGTYYWSVQAIDHAYAASAFAPEQSFTVGGASLAFSDAALDFGPVAVSTRASLRLGLANTGSDTLMLTSVATSGANAGDFSVDEFEGHAIAAGAEIDFSVSFDAQTIGVKSATLEFSDQGGNLLGAITLKAEVTETSRSFLTLAAKTVDFFEVRVGQTKTSALQLANSGNAIMTVRDIRLEGAAASDYSIVDRSRLPLRIGPGDAEALELAFAPTQTKLRSASFEIVTDTAMPQNVVLVRGSGLSASVFLSRANLDFEPANVGEFQDLPLTFRNDGADTVAIAAAEMSGAGASDFQALFQPPATLLPGEDETFFVRFQPQSPGLKSAVLHVTAGADSSEIGAVELEGTGLDESPPGLVNTTLATTVAQGSSFEVSAQVEDNFSIQSVTLFFRAGGGATSVEKQMQRRADNRYTFDIAADTTSEIPLTRGLEYRIVARDGVEQPTESEWTPVQVRLSENAISTTQIGGVEDGAYRLIAVPLALENASVDAVFGDDLGQQNIKDWRLWRIDPANANADFPYLETTGNDQFFPGSARFLIISENAAITAGAGLTPKTLEFFEIPLHEGWNMVGNPFNFNVRIENVDLKSDGSRPSIFGFEGDFREAQLLAPWTGYLVKAAGGVDTLRIWPSEDILDRTQDLAKPAGGLDWRIKLSAASSDVRDVENYVGAAKDASPEWDRHELFEPPPIGEFVKLWFAQQDWAQFPDNYTTDFQPPSEDGHVWEFRVQSSLGEPVTLQFDELESAPEHFEIRLFDLQLHHAVDVRREGAYVFSPLRSGANRFKLVVGTADFVEQESENALGLPTTFELAQNFPNPFNPATTIRYGLPQNAKVTLKIYNLLGREVVTLVDDEEKPAGYHFSVWDGRNRSGERVASGVFIYQIQAGEIVQTKKMILVK